MSTLSDAIKSLWGYQRYQNRKEKKETLNQQINNWTINESPQLTSGFSDLTLNQQINNWQIWWDDYLSNVPDNSPDSMSAWFINPSTQVTEESWNVLAEKAKKQQEEEESWILSRLWKWTKSIPWAVSDYFKWQKADSDAQAKEKWVAIWYDEDNWDVLYLDLNEDRWLFDLTWWRTRDWTRELYDKYKQEFIDQVNNPYATQESTIEAWNEFYNNTKWLFRIRADDYYSDWFFFNDNWTRIGRRKDNFTQDELNTLAQNNVKKWKYDNLSFEEWMEFVQADFDNQEIKQNIYSWYGLASDDNTDKITLSKAAQQDWFWWYQDTAMAWVEEALQTYIGSKNPNARNNALLNIYSAVNDQATREWTILQPIYAAEQVVLAKPANERTEWEKELLEKANLLRKLEVAAAKWLNNWAIQEIKYWTNNKWEIVESLDNFEWNQSLSDVLSWEVKRLAWWKWSSSDSTIDVMQQIANEALYSYHKWKGTWWTKAWRWVQKALSPVWQWLWEAWQQVSMKIMQAQNLIYSTVTPWNWDDLARKVNWEEAVSATATYLDQDFTVGRLIETDDWNIKRTIKKYLLEGAEYIPEIAGNLAPDIIIAAVTWWVWWVTAIRNIPRAYKAVKAMKWLSTLNKIRAFWSDLKWWAQWIQWLKNAITSIKSVNQWWKVAWELADRAITQWLIDQAMDAQWSAFDTEAYSWTSETLSLLWTVWMNLIPELRKWDLISWIRKIFQPDSVSWSIWDVADYMSSSPQAAQNIANVLWRNVSDIWVDDLRMFARNFKDISDAAKAAYDQLPIEWKNAANKWTKDLMNNYINQIYWSNSEIAKTARIILSNGSTNPADLIKYLGKIPGEVSFWPYVSSIRLKNWTQASAILKNANYDRQLDSLAWWFDSRLKNWFTQADIEDISKLKWFSDVPSKQWDLFYEYWGRKYLTEEWLDRFWLKAESMPLETLWITLSEAEDTRELFKEKMKNIKDKNISDTTIDAVADSWAYNEIVSKVKEIVC